MLIECDLGVAVYVPGSRIGTNVFCFDFHFSR